MHMYQLYIDDPLRLPDFPQKSQGKLPAGLTVPVAFLTVFSLYPEHTTAHRAEHAGIMAQQIVILVYMRISEIMIVQPLYDLSANPV